MAEAFATAAIHPTQCHRFIFASEDAAKKMQPTSVTLLDLAEELQNNVKLRECIRWDDGPNKLLTSIYPRCLDELASIVAKWTVAPDQLDDKLAEIMHAASKSRLQTQNLILY